MRNLNYELKQLCRRSRGGSFATQILDFSAPLGGQIVQNLANRFRLERIDPTAPRSRVRRRAWSRSS